jgi:hypothetical protein
MSFGATPQHLPEREQFPNPASLNEAISWSRLGECDFLGRPSMTP